MNKKKHEKYALFIGRWQPFHLGHKYIIDKAIDEGKNVAIAIRDTEMSEKNPYTVEQRKEMINRVYGDRVKTFRICDIESVNIGREVGYDVNRIEVPEEIKEISGTDQRKETIPTDTPDEVKEYIASVSPTFWFYGLPSSGKSTLAKQLKEILADKNRRVMHFDGDILRGGLNEDLGFSPEDREENLRRAAHLAKLFNQKGHSTVCSFITPRKEMREMIKDIVPNLTFIYVECPLEVCKERDVKGMYEKAEKGEIDDFTGIDAPFEEPENPDVKVNSDKLSEEEALEKIIDEAEQIDL